MQFISWSHVRNTCKGSSAFYFWFKKFTFSKIYTGEASQKSEIKLQKVKMFPFPIFLLWQVCIFNQLKFDSLEKMIVDRTLLWVLYCRSASNCFIHIVHLSFLPKINKYIKTRGRSSSRFAEEVLVVKNLWLSLKISKTNHFYWNITYINQTKIEITRLKVFSVSRNQQRKSTEQAIRKQKLLEQTKSETK